MYGVVYQTCFVKTPLYVTILHTTIYYRCITHRTVVIHCRNKTTLPYNILHYLYFTHTFRAVHTLYNTIYKFTYFTSSHILHILHFIHISTTHLIWKHIRNNTIQNINFNTIQLFHIVNIFATLHMQYFHVWTTIKHITTYPCSTSYLLNIFQHATILFTKYSSCTTRIIHAW